MRDDSLEEDVWLEGGEEGWPETIRTGRWMERGRFGWTGRERVW